MDVYEHRQVVKLFIQDVNEALVQFDEHLSVLEREGATQRIIERLGRTLHSIKGSAAALGFAEVAEFAHHVEGYVKALGRHEQLSRSEIYHLLDTAKSYIHEHIQSLHDKKVPPTGGDKIVRAMEDALKPKLVSLVLRLPRAPLAGDIWFMSDDFEFELFEMPQPPSNEDNLPPAQPTDPEQFEIRSEILRLTQLAAAVNLNTILAAQNMGVHESQISTAPEARATANEEWSLAGLEPNRGEEEQDLSETKALSIFDFDRLARAEISNTIQAETQEQIDFVAEKEPALSPKEVISAQVQEVTNLMYRGDSEDSIEQIDDENEAASHNSIEDSLKVEVESHSEHLVEENNIQVRLKDVDELLNLAEELVTLQNILDEHKPVFETPLLQKTISRLSKLIAQTQELSMSMKMVRFSSLFNAISTHAQRQALLYHKDVQPEIEGGDAEIDKSILDSVLKPLSHLVSNAIEHGIESADVRLEKGKPPQGRVTVALKLSPKEVIFEVSDDGRGLDIAQIRKKAIECGLMARLDRMSDEHIRSFIFHPGFTTRASDIDDDEQQGLGLHQLSTFVLKSKGRIEIDSIRDHGTVFRIILPKSISVIEAFVVRVGSERFVIPKDQIAESVSSHEAQVDVIQGHQQLLNVRGNSVPLIQLNTILKRLAVPFKEEAQFSGVALIAQESDSRPVAVIVDDIVCQKKVVIKPLGRELQSLKGLSGAAILGDGKPSVILNLHELIASYLGERTERFVRSSA